MQILAGGMRSLIDLWNKRRLSSLEEVTRFREAVRAVSVRVNGGAGGPEAPARLAPPRTFKAEEALVRVEDPAVAFRAAAGSVTVSAVADGKHDVALGNREAVPLTSGHRYRIEVAGAYRAAAPPLVQPGDELVARLAYRAVGAATIQLALRSLEDPEAAESTETVTAAAGDAAKHEAKLTADPQQTGFYLGVTVKGAPGRLHRGRAAPRRRRDRHGTAGRRGRAHRLCRADLQGAGRPLRCQPGEGDRVTLGQPDGYLVLGVRDSTGLRASTRTLSLEGGRSIDALVGEGAQLVVTLVGSGSATLDRIKVTDLGL